MPRSRGSEVVQKPTLRGSHKLRTSSSDSEPLHHRPITDRSPKLGDRRSPRGSQSDPLNQKKLGTRLADLESQLGQAQDELKSLKEQLASAEAAKKEAQEKLDKKAKKPVVTSEPVKISETHPPSESEDSNRTDSCPSDDNSQRETDVFEVPAEKVSAEPKVETNETDQVEEETKPIDISAEPPLIVEPEKSPFHDLALKNEEIDMLKAKLEEKENEVEVFGQENDSLRNQLKEAAMNISTAEVKEKEMALKSSKFEEELEASKANAAELSEKLKAIEEVKEALEAEMKKMRVQTEQWKKAADAAATILAGGVEMNGRISERCGSMDKHFGGVFDPPGGGYAGFVGSPAADDLDDGFGSGKRKGSGIKMFGDLWRKKGQK
ncbi:PREDICTED: interactor of constitutive active ROPs 1-like isoform 2 [Fragaria vesca subsp. vesca]|uniref:interactor of constitutive active ROPs 1-like n=1 Tax=Fragaria vesca subsp. vesca TaxID=101020 RepID=UPI0002C37257|nr:PREDICTED: interactor of constitutive active ROPs 1-like [Fragaria vesca subsp. vesca]XP_011460728.1 PREDICTED: interactor of constitutive active ROPs 1-like [Fragaria vesca subsp. vesca]XP_011460729.1 PREDICTED: interactor of constitutive active ROPs 1-like [Fragaria vesca subsp. vesca]